MKTQRDLLSMTQWEFAALLGVHPVTVSKWERGTCKPTQWQTEIACLVSESPRRGQLRSILHRNGHACALAVGLSWMTAIADRK